MQHRYTVTRRLIFASLFGPLVCESLNQSYPVPHLSIRTSSLLVLYSSPKYAQVIAPAFSTFTHTTTPTCRYPSCDYLCQSSIYTGNKICSYNLGAIIFQFANVRSINVRLSIQVNFFKRRPIRPPPLS